MYVCMYVCMHECMHACMHARTHARTYVRLYTYMCARVWVCARWVCVRVRILCWTALEIGYDKPF